MKKFVRGVLTTVLVFTFTLISTIVYTERTINNDLIGKYFKEELTSQMLEFFTDNLDNLKEEEYNEIKDSLENNEEINAFVNKFSNRFIKDLSKEKIDDVYFDEDIKSILLGNKDIIEKIIEREVTEEEIDEVIDEDIKNTYQQIIEESRNDFNEDERALIDGYNILTSSEFVIILILISIISIIVIAILKKPGYKWIKNVAIAGGVSALFTALIGSSLSIVMNLALETLGENIRISAIPIIITVVMMLLISIILIIIDNSINKKAKKSITL